MDIQKILQLIPNSVSGDGKTFVAALKNYLTKYGLVTDEKIDSALEELTKKPNHVDNITLLELHAITDGVRSNNIQINWDSTPVSDYAKAEIWYTCSADSSWEKAGEASGTQYVLQGVTAGETYYIRVIAVNSKGTTANFITAPMANITIKGSQYIPSPPTQFVLTWDEQGPLWKWLFEDNNYVDFFELRLDQNPGVWNDKRLDSTRETWSRANPDVRAGTAYLYIRNVFGEYSEPAVHQFNKAMPGKPEAPVLTATLDGVRIKMSPLPQGATGYKIHIKTSDGTENDFTTANSEYIYFFFLGTITVKYCIVDVLGEGEWSDEATCDIKAGIDVGQVPTIDYDKLGDTVKNAVDIANKQPDINIGFGNNIKDINADIGNINTSIADIDTDISNIKNNITNINSTIDGLDVASINATMAELDKNITANTSSIQQNAESITAVVTRVDSAEKNITQHGTAIKQNADSITAIAKKVTAVEGNVTENTTAIQQNATDITSLAKKVTTNTQGITANTSSIQQNAESITAVVTRVDSADANIDSLASALAVTATAVQQNADSITTVAKRVINTENGLEEHSSSIQQNANSISAVVKRVTTVEGEVTAHGTAINQTADNITAVVTELNKKPADCNYSSISMLQDDILLTVKKDGVINAINVSTEGIVIDGNKVHITGDTVFDNNVIVGGMIAADSIALEHLKANSVSSAKIQANAVTSDKIKAGAVTADKIEAGAITAEKLAAGSVTSDAIQARSVIGDKIAANAISGKHLAAENIDLLGALSITSGNVKLSEEGLRLIGGDSSYTLFNAEGINYIDKNGVTYAQVKKMIIGKAYDNQYIKFAAPWAKPPTVLMSPMSIKVNDSDYSASSLFLVCEATDVSVNGFRVNSYLRLADDSYGVNNIAKTDTPSEFVVESMEQYWYGHYSYAYTFVCRSDVSQITIPSTAKYIELSLQLDITNPFSNYDYDGDSNSGSYSNGHLWVKYPGANSGWTKLDSDSRTVIVQLIVANKVLQEITFTTGDKTGVVIKNFILSASFEAGATEAVVRVRWKYNLKTGEHGSWQTIYNGKSYIAEATCKCSLKRTYYKIAASNAKIARGYATFLVTDGSTNIYSAETFVRVLINYDGSPLTNKTISANGENYTTDADGYIEMKGFDYKEYTFMYGTAPPVNATVTFTDGVVTTVNIAPANVTCYIKVTYNGEVVANQTVKVDNMDRTTDEDGKVAVGGLDNHSGQYTIAYKNDSVTITVNYVDGSTTTAELFELQDGSKEWTWQEASNKNISFTVPNGAHRIKIEASVDWAEGDAYMEYSASITNTANNKVWGSGYSYAGDSGENESHVDVGSVVAVTPGKTYNLLFDCGSTNGVKFSWGRAIDKETATVIDNEE